MATKMTREEAIKKVRQMSLPKETMEILKALAPELRESEDERIWEALCDFVSDTLEDYLSDYGISKGEALAYLEKQKEQKPAEWSEEDEEILKLLILNIGRYMYFGGMSSERILSFLKSLRPQPKKGYSDEDEDRISDVLWCIEQSRKVAKNENDMGTCWSAERFVKSLRPQQRQEWSDEEKEILDSILSHYVLIDKPIDANGIPKEKYISLIKSIRFDTYKNCNSHWKPSEEQPDVDIREEIKKLEFMGSNDARDIEAVAKHFYGLGLKNHDN